jgi:ribosomal protein S1
VKSPNDVVKSGDEVKVRVLEVDEKSRRMSLSLKRAMESVPTPAAARPDQPSKKKKRPELRGGLDWNW